MKTHSFPAAITHLVETKNYPEIINEVLQLIIDGKMNYIALNELLAQKGIRRITDLKKYTLDVILDYAELILEDDILTSNELKDIRLLKMFFQFKEGDFLANGKYDRVEKIITEQCEKLYADNVIDPKEMLHKSDLQGVFGLGYDECAKIVNQVAIKALARGANIKDLDTYL